jgi:hypothetical protein
MLNDLQGSEILQLRYCAASKRHKQRWCGVKIERKNASRTHNGPIDRKVNIIYKD